MDNAQSTESIFNFEKLIVYQKALDYVDLVYEITEKFPSYELYALSSQFRRAAYSIALNTGERCPAVLTMISIIFYEYPNDQ